jgi:uncharacterized protein YrrD
MLVNGSQLIDTPIMGLHTGAELAKTKTPIIDPSNLKIVAYEVDGPLLDQRPSLIRIADIREMSDIGLIVDSSDEFISIDDVIAIKKIYDLNFRLIGLNVVDELKHKIGRVSEYNINTSTFIIEQLGVKPGILKSLAEHELLIHRSQIIEISDTTIVVKSAAKKLQPVTETETLTYLNPFRSSTPQLDQQGVNPPTEPA